MSDFTQTAVIGAGVIGASWTALFLAAGKDVRVFDPSETARADVEDYVARAWPTLKEIGLAETGRRGSLTFAETPEEAAAGADFVQENVPERIDIKLDLYRRIEPHLKPGCIVASSASGLMVKEMQAGWKDPSNFVLGHPFNPPHLIPLVEIIGNDRTSPDAVTAAERFYAEVGKTTIRVNKEVPGHVANRLQAALWREARSGEKLGKFLNRNAKLWRVITNPPPDPESKQNFQISRCLNQVKFLGVPGRSPKSSHPKPKRLIIQRL